MLAEDAHSLQYPDTVQIDEDIKGLIGRYYAAFDTCGGQDECAQCFAEDAVITAPNGVQIHGREGKQTNSITPEGPCQLTAIPVLS